MGAVTFSINPNLINTLKKSLPIDTFVETGTFKGDTIELIKNDFKDIYTVELSKTYYEMAQQQFAEMPHIQVFMDHSPAFLRSVHAKTNHQATIYWLDAHWCVADATAGEYSQCPLLDEIAAIQTLNENSVIVIDDARLFLATPPYPHEVSDWPTLDAIIKALYQLSNHHRVMVINDNIIFYPEQITAEIAQYAYEYGADWLNIYDKSRDYDKLLEQLHEKDKLIEILNQACQHKEKAIEQQNVIMKQQEEIISALQVKYLRTPIKNAIKKLLPSKIRHSIKSTFKAITHSGKQ